MLKIKKLCFSFLFALFLCGGLLALSAVFVCKLGSLNDKISGMLGLLSGVLSIGISSVLAARWVGERGLVHGLFLSVIFSAIYFLFGMLFGCELALSTAFIRILSFILSGALGGMIGVNKTQHIRF